MADTTLDEGVGFEAFLDQAQRDFEQTQRDLKEIEILIKQSSAEVERLAQRNAQVTNQVRQLQTNFETLPRDYIREVFESQNDTQQRLFTMRGQLEKLQSDQRNLEKLSELYRHLFEYTMGGSPLTVGVGGQQMRKEGDASGVIRVIQTEEAAKQSLVREMHDGPASSLSNFILQAEICQRFFDIDPDRARAELNALKSAAASTFNDVKDFIFDLRPMMLDDLGVVPTLRRYVESFEEKSNLPVSITVTGAERRLESHVEVTIFRGVQELLNNAMSHAQPTQLQVSLDIEQDQVTAIVEDNGSGFAVDEVINGSAPTIGLSALRERIQMLGGETDIQSRVGHGTRVAFSIPVKETIVI